MTHYDTLEVSPQASPEVVRAAYKSLIQRAHPDRHPGDATIAARAVAIIEAYKVLSEAQSRTAYDQRLAQRKAVADESATPARARTVTLGRAQPARRGPPARVGLTGWILCLAAFSGVVWGAVWLASPGANPRSELLSIRSTYAQGGVPEMRLRELYARKEALLRQSPELQAAAAAERASNRNGRTLELLDAPLVVQLEKAELTIPRLRVVLGTFDTASARNTLELNRGRLGRDLANSLARGDANRLGSGSDAYLKTLVTGTLAQALGTPPEDEYPSTYFESPGRHGVVDVLLPEGHALRLH
jgi:curved DNA-binding protein CbpA